MINTFENRASFLRYIFISCLLALFLLGNVSLVNSWSHFQSNSTETHQVDNDITEDELIQEGSQVNNSILQTTNLTSFFYLTVLVKAPSAIWQPPE